MNTLQNLIATSLMLLTTTAATQDHAPVNIGDDLPPNVRSLLIQEMQAILTASQTILEGIVTGQHELVAEQAQGIHDSFILQQEMTPEDRKALVAAVPEAFVQRDRAFHQLSAELAEAARAGDPARERALFGKMVDACAGCHARYAGGRFPGLKAD